MRLFALLLLTGCGSHVIRDTVTYQTETIAALERQQEAANALRIAAEDARARGDLAACERYAGPALLIEAAAQAQAYRALWLAGLKYPGAPDGDVDPGPSATVAPISTICH